MEDCFKCRLLFLWTVYIICWDIHVNFTNSLGLLNNTANPSEVESTQETPDDVNYLPFVIELFIKKLNVSISSQSIFETNTFVNVHKGAMVKRKNGMTEAKNRSGKKGKTRKNMDKLFLTTGITILPLNSCLT